jgi:hypothetical protein
MSVVIYSGLLHLLVCLLDHPPDPKDMPAGNSPLQPSLLAGMLSVVLPHIFLSRNSLFAHAVDTVSLRDAVVRPWRALGLPTVAVSFAFSLCHKNLLLLSSILLYFLRNT